MATASFHEPEFKHGIIIAEETLTLVELFHVRFQTNGELLIFQLFDDYPNYSGAIQDAGKP
jgi:hypothetical protein